MKKILLGLLLTTTAWAVSSGDKATYSNKYMDGANPTPINYIKNPSCLRNAVNLTGTNTTPSRNTTTPLTSIADCQSTLDSSSDTVDLGTNTLDRSLKNGNCEASINYNLTVGSGNTIELQARINSATVASVALTTATNGTATVNFPCGDLSNAPSLRIAQTAGSTSQAINWANAYLGAARNIGTVAQAQLMGTLKVTGCSGNWDTTSASYASGTTRTGCTYTATGQASSPSTMIAAFKFASLPPGEYMIQYEGAVGLSTGSGQQAYFKFTDGTNDAREESAIENSTSLRVTGINQSISYSTAQSNVQFEIKMKVSGGSTAFVTGTSTYPGVFKLWRFPSSSEIAVRPNQAGASYSGTMVGAGGGWSTTSTSYADPSVATTSNTLTQIVANNLSCVAESTKLPGITCTFTAAGNYLVMASPSIKNASTSSALARLVNGSTIIDGGVISSGASTAGSEPTKLAGIVNVAAAGSQTFKIQLMTSNASNATSINQQTESPITWTVVQVDYGMQTPILVGSVTSNSTGAERIERAYITNNGTTCSVSSQSGSWISSVSRSTGGTCSIVIATGMFSSAPVCNATAIDTGGPADVNAGLTAAPTTTSVIVETRNLASSATDKDFQIICMGPR